MEKVLDPVRGIAQDTSGLDRWLEHAPFGPRDVTAGAENEWLASVRGSAQQVDLPRTVSESNYYKNLVRRAASGDASKRLVRDLDAYLADQPGGPWENSWVYFPVHHLHPYARQVLDDDLYADKRVRGERRSDVHRFLVHREGEECARVPVSYLLKLALADMLGRDTAPGSQARATGEQLMRHFLNDNTSPETYSFHLVGDSARRTVGRALAQETLRRFLLAHALTQYANEAFGLRENGQETSIGMSPQTPVRQKALNELVADSYYRDLFMSPCLSGWDKGEAKHQYMILCHEVLSRSRLNTMGKLRECGILSRNLVTLPAVSNTSLANNGTHISLGSRMLTQLRASGSEAFSAVDEKQAGDLVLKITEHFLPLFVGAYSAAPGRFDFQDFHPETVLGFLPHELDYTHLRMIWRRWKGKADLQRLGIKLTPFGPKPLDRFVAGLMRLRGDWVPDQRLLDYLVAPLSTDHSPALDGTPDNDARLKRDLAEMGVFDTRLSWYALCRQRLHAHMGYCGFEGRFYSQFASITNDMAAATDMQRLITALAFQYVWRGEVTHADIPDTPEVESERRQIFFGSAIGLPTFFVRNRTDNRFLTRILNRAARIRDSHRYPGRVRVYHREYRHALLDVLEEDGAGLIEALGLRAVVRDLRERIEPQRGRSALDQLMKGILEEAGGSKPLKLNAAAFNSAAERFYAGKLHQRFLQEAFDVLEDDMHDLALPADNLHALRDSLRHGPGTREQWSHLIATLMTVIDARARQEGTGS
jgi:hypothetical protein